MCQPPRQRMETLTPVLPSGRWGSPLPAGSWPAAAVPRAAAAVAAPAVWRNSRRVSSVLGVSLIAVLRVGEGAIRRGLGYRAAAAMARDLAAGSPAVFDTPTACGLDGQVPPSRHARRLPGHLE